MKHFKKLSLISFVLLVVFSSCQKNKTAAIQSIETPPVVLSDNDNLLMGNPSNAITTLDSPTNYLIQKGYYSLSYNSFRGTPNWVSWHLYQPDLGSSGRSTDTFFPDSVYLPVSWYHVTDASYTGSGFDRGHNCPSGDRTKDTASNGFTFVMDNVIPQAPYQNENTWANMENYIRSQIYTGDEAYIIMGSYGIGGTGNNGLEQTVDNGYVTVPATIWKIVVLIPNGNGDLSRITTSTRVIAANIPNSNTVNANWKIYRTSINSIEAATGYKFLTALPTSVQTVLKAEVDNQ